MNNIIKRRKTSNYLQLHNYPVQEDLNDLAAIGLLTYIMSLPEDWVLYKTQLQEKFSRRRVDSAWKILTEKKYAVGFSCYIEGKKQYFYNVSDIAFTENEFIDFVKETLRSLIQQNLSISSPEEIKDNAFKIKDNPEILSIVQNVQQSKITDVQNVQYKKYNTKCTVQSVQVQNKYKQKKYEQINNNKINNIVNLQEQINNKEINVNNVDNIKNEMLHIANEFYNEFAPGRWAKDQWYSLITRFIDETIESKRYKNIEKDKIRGYIYKSIENIAHYYDIKYKKSNITKEEINGIPILDWVFGGNED